MALGQLWLDFQEASRTALRRICILVENSRNYLSDRLRRRPFYSNDVDTIIDKPVDIEFTDYRTCETYTYPTKYTGFAKYRNILSNINKGIGNYVVEIIIERIDHDISDFKSEAYFFSHNRTSKFYPYNGAVKEIKICENIGDKSSISFYVLSLINGQMHHFFETDFYFIDIDGSVSNIAFATNEFARKISNSMRFCEINNTLMLR